MTPLSALWQYIRARFDLATSDDRGAVTTEMAVVIFVLVTAALGVLAVIAAAAMDTANSIPVPEGQ